MKIDGGLRGLFKDHLLHAQWTAIESPLTKKGIPDSEVCFKGGGQCWVEFKKTTGFAVDVTPFQIAWHEQRHRMGGKSFIAVRRVTRKVDELHLFWGSDARRLKLEGLKAGPSPIGVWDRGPSRWDWGEVRQVLAGAESSLK
jgi:hypothetical protein